MIDKPQGKVEHYVELLFKVCKSKLQAVFESAHWSKLKEAHHAHPYMAKVISSTACVLVFGLLIVGFATPKTVSVTVDDSLNLTTTIYETTSMRVDGFIKNHDIDYVYGVDLIDVELYDAISDGMEINITKAFDVSLVVDGEKYNYTTLPTSTRDILNEMEIKVGPNDIVEPEIDAPVHKGETIVVKRVKIEYEEETIETKFATKYVADSSLRIGDTKVSKKGRKGIEKKTYKVVYVDGKATEKTLINSETVQEGRDKIISYGTKITKGKPAGLKYKEKISKVRALSYYYPGSPKGVYGLDCEYGTCAVDRDLIPLGSLLYIEGYGYAVANDVGGAIKGKTVDLYMERLSQCGIWGARWTNVYIIEYGNDKRYWE